MSFEVRLGRLEAVRKGSAEPPVTFAEMIAASDRLGERARRHIHKLAGLPLDCFPELEGDIPTTEEDRATVKQWNLEYGVTPMSDTEWDAYQVRLAVRIPIYIAERMPR